MQTINPTLLKLAEWRASGEVEKQGFVPTGATDPAAMGGGAPPMDPAAMGGAPPMDPAAAGGMPPGAPPMDPMAAGGAPPDIQGMIMQAVQQAMGGQGGMGAPGAAGPGKGAKIDPGMIYMELGRVRKLLTHLFQHLNIDLPPDILDDQMVAQSVAGQQPVSQPTDAAPPADPAAAGGGAPPGLPGIGQSAPINPVEPAAPAGGEKMSSVMDMFRQDLTDVSSSDFEETGSALDAVAMLARKLNAA
jgi:hypothetical protein